jgi:hypothetical protein
VHIQLFSEDNLPPGNHTLIFTVQQFDNASIDYILYKPSFPNIQDKPAFTTMADVIGTPTSDPTPAGTGSTPGPTDAATPASSMPKTDAIAGEVVGGIMVFLLAILGLWLWKRTNYSRRMREEAQAKVQEPYIQTSTRRLGMNLNYF